VSTPTAVPRRKSSTYRDVYVGVRERDEARIPKSAVKNNVVSKAAGAPSKQVPHPIAPRIVPANMGEETSPM
jgi:hypothetical protein